MSTNFKDVPHHPKSNSRMMLGGTTIIDGLDSEECRILRDYANRALLEIIRLRKRQPFLDDKIQLYTEKSNSSMTGVIKVDLKELHTLLDELDAVLDHAYELKRISEKKSTNSSKLKQRGIGKRRQHNRRHYQSTSGNQLPLVSGQNHLHNHFLPSSKKQDIKLEVTLIRRTQLNESET